MDWILISILVCNFLQFSYTVDHFKEQQQALSVLDKLNKELEPVFNKLIRCTWDYITNITDENAQKIVEATTNFSNFEKYAAYESSKFNYNDFPNETIKKQFSMYAVVGGGVLSEDKRAQLTKLKTDMGKIYSTATICDYKNKSKCNLPLEPDIREIFRTSRDPEELKHVWVQFRDAIGPSVRPLFKKYVELENEQARLNDYNDAGQLWLTAYHDATIKEQIESLWLQIKPFYLELHAYVRFNLRKIYGDLVPERGPIPVHLLGCIWGQSWTSLETLFKPFPNAEKEDLTAEMKRQNYTVMKIFKTAEEFFTSINLTKLPDSFWEKSLFEKPTDRSVVCHPLSVDFRDGKDFRIKQCTEITFEYFLITHHEMGHIEYFMQYKDLPIILRQAANPAFQEAIGDLIALSVQSPKHLRKLGLLKSKSDTYENTINHLFRIALEKITFLAAAYPVDLWRWAVFSGGITQENYNCKWWELLEKYEGVSPPVNRSEDDFDPASLYHVVAGSQYVEYFIAYILQFQFHKTLCEIAGEYDPNDSSKSLFECDIYQNTHAGNALKNMLKIGDSQTWHDALESLTGQRKMDASGLLEYFKPLREWLQKENKKNKVVLGWEHLENSDVSFCNKAKN